MSETAAFPSDGSDTFPYSSFLEFVEHYHRERNHQGLGNRLITEDESGVGRTGAIHCRQRLGARTVRGLVAGGRPEP
jgi:hypothetical protein